MIGLLLALAQSPTVTVTGGRVAGVVAPSGIREFRGIPFAAPPIGDLRWKAPQPVVPWKGVKDASSFGPRCMQKYVFQDMQFRSPGFSEDCLTLNVWAPPHGKTKLPVLLYFYGGGYIAGDASEFRYDGEHMARRGMIVVTANYRLGVFGFLALPELAHESPHSVSGDYGIVDQIAALDWVAHNIAAFGGDPERITVGGESAGSLSVTALTLSPLSRDMIAGAIGESGALLSPTFPPVPLDSAIQQGLDFTQALGGLSLSALRALPADVLLTRANGKRFSIAIDGWVLTAPPETTLVHGWQSHVPMLLGWNSEEGSWRHYFDSTPPTPENWRQVLQGEFGDAADSALRYFPGSDPGQVKESATLLSGAYFTVLSTWKWAQMAARSGAHPVYVYVFTRPRPGATGAVHSAEIEYVLGNLGTNHVYAWTPEDTLTSYDAQAYFASFVRNGVPKAGQLPQWPALASTSPQVMVLNEHPHADSASFAAALQFLDSYLRHRFP